MSRTDRKSYPMGFPESNRATEGTDRSGTATAIHIGTVEPLGVERDALSMWERGRGCDSAAATPLPRQVHPPAAASLCLPGAEQGVDECAEREWPSQGRRHEPQISGESWAMPRAGTPTEKSPPGSVNSPLMIGPIWFVQVCVVRSSSHEPAVPQPGYWAPESVLIRRYVQFNNRGIVTFLSPDF